MHIGIDARLYGAKRHKGLGRYIEELIKNVLALGTNDTYTIFVFDENKDDFLVKEGDPVEGDRKGRPYAWVDDPRVKIVPVNWPWYSAYEQIMWPRVIGESKVDVMHFPHFSAPWKCPVPYVVTLHDVIMFRENRARDVSTLPTWKYYLKRWVLLKSVGHVVKNAAALITVSEYSKQEIAKMFKVALEKIYVTYEGTTSPPALPQGEGARADVLEKFNIIKPYLLSVGAAYPHKNLITTVKVLQELKERGENYQLVLVGKIDYFYERLKEEIKKLGLEVGGDVILTDAISDDDLVQLYLQAKIFLFLSKEEGFGLPGLEAMSYGVPVIASDSSCLPEIFGHGALYCAPEDVSGIISLIIKLESDKILRDGLVAFGFEQTKQYSWKKCAEETNKIYQEIIKQKS